jgi:hypothetical protein
MPSAYSFVLTLRSLSPMIGRLHPLSLYTLSFQAPPCSCFVGKLPRFRNSRNVENEGYFPRHEAIEAVAFLLKKADI